MGEDSTLSRRGFVGLSCAALGVVAVGSLPAAAWAAASEVSAGGHKTAKSGTLLVHINSGSAKSALKLTLSRASSISYDAAAAKASTWKIALSGTNSHKASLGASSLTTKKDNRDEYWIVNIPLKITVPAHYLYGSGPNDKGGGNFRLNWYTYNQYNTTGGTNTAKQKCTHSASSREVTLNIQANIKAFACATQNQYWYRGCSITLNLSPGRETLSLDPEGGTFDGYVPGFADGRMDYSTKSCGSRSGDPYNKSKGLPCPTRRGYFFDGWRFDRSEGGGAGEMLGAEFTYEGAGGYEDSLALSAYVGGAWQPSVADCQLTNQAAVGEIKGLRFSTSGPTTGSVEARMYFAGVGWSDWAAPGTDVGGPGSGSATALEMRLTGSLAEKYDLYYHVYTGDGSKRWMPWVKEGASDPGGGCKVSSVQAALVEKGRGYPFGQSYLHEGSALSGSYSIYRAAWVDAWYRVTYDANGGEGAPEPQRKDRGASISLREGVPTREGHLFTCWCESADGEGARWDPAAVYSEDRDLALYALWQRIPDHPEKDARVEAWA